MKPIPYGRQHITAEDIEAVVSSLKSDFMTQGPAVPEFEKAFAEYIGAKYAVAISNGTAALHLAAMALQVQPGQTVITTPITFVASANCIKYCGANVEFADINEETFLLDIGKVQNLIESKPSGYYNGIITVDFAGYPTQLEELKQLANLHGLWIIEDACHSPGAAFKDSIGNSQKCGNGNFADLAVFSFHPVKHIATGEGGMITTNNENLYRKLLKLRTHGITKEPDLLIENHGGWYYEMQELGYNYRLTDLQAALGSSQLKRADEGLLKRNEIAKIYDKNFSGTVVKIPFRAEDIFHAFHLYIVQVNNRLEVYNHLREKGIFSQVHYIPVHLQPYYKQFGNNFGSFPIAEKYYENCLSLPMFPTLTDEEQMHVIQSVLEIAK